MISECIPKYRIIDQLQTKKISVFIRKYSILDPQIQWKMHYIKMTSSFISMYKILSIKIFVHQFDDGVIGGIKYNDLLRLISVLGYKINF